ncbi:MAG: 23S rRNA (pseudouridine(1915)-N(3))-methyltransferase RlmH [Myxococcales bacterium]|nr:23S rRNA (pseudouridine(1915)-N(3))-methyltransferase RlmH [Myxococcales bacterium]
MRLGLAAVGRIKEPELRTLLDDYYGRIKRYAEFGEVELKDDDREDRVVAQFTKAVSGFGPRAEVVALEVRGERLSSEGFAEKLDTFLQRSAVPVFVIGGAEGLPQGFSQAARWRVSLGPMTLPHRLARLIVAEQLYRAFTILRREPYNK